MPFILNLQNNYIFRLGLDMMLEIEIITNDEFVEYSFYRLGLETMHHLTSEGEYTLRVELTDWEGGSAYEEYDGFSVGSGAGGYTLHVGQYRGNARNSLSYDSGARFSTYENGYTYCVLNYGGGGGWWHNGCYYANLNGEYRSSPQHTTQSHGGIVWYHWKSTY